MKVLVIALLVSGLLSFAAATYLTVMIGFDFMPYSKARGTYVGVLFFFGSGFMYATAMALKSARRVPNLNQMRQATGNHAEQV